MSNNVIKEAQEYKSKRTKSAKSVGGRKKQVERDRLQATSSTYKLNAAKKLPINKDGYIFLQLRLSKELEMSEGDKSQYILCKEYAKELCKEFGIEWDEKKIIESWEIGSAWKKGKHRPHMDKLLNMMKNRELAFGLAFDVSRWTRDKYVGRLMAQYAIAYNIPIRVYNDKSLMPEIDELSQTLRWEIAIENAEKASNDTSDRIKRTHLTNSYEGRIRGGDGLLGMKKVLNANGKNSYVPNEDIREDYPSNIGSEAGLIRFIFNRALEGKTFYAISVELNDLGIKPRRTNKFSDMAVKRLLNNAHYAGYSVYHGKIAKDLNGNILTPHQGVITADIYHKVQESHFGIKKGLKGDGSKFKAKLIGTIVCDLCGRSLKTQKGYADRDKTIEIGYYICSSAGAGQRCAGKSITINKLDDYIYKYIIEYFKHQNIKLKTSPTVDTHIYDGQITELEAKINKYQDKIKDTNDADDIDLYTSHINKLSTELDTLIAKKDLVINNTQIKDFDLDDFINSWESDFRLARQYVATVFNKITLISAEGAYKFMNQWDLKRQNMPLNLDRIEVEFKDGSKVNLGDEYRAQKR